MLSHDSRMILVILMSIEREGINLSSKLGFLIKESSKCWLLFNIFELLLPLISVLQKYEILIVEVIPSVVVIREHIRNYIIKDIN